MKTGLVLAAFAIIFGGAVLVTRQGVIKTTAEGEDERLFDVAVEHTVDGDFLVPNENASLKMTLRFDPKNGLVSQFANQPVGPIAGSAIRSLSQGAVSFQFDSGSKLGIFAVYKDGSAKIQNWYPLVGLKLPREALYEADLNLYTVFYPYDQDKDKIDRYELRLLANGKIIDAPSFAHQFVCPPVVGSAHSACEWQGDKDEMVLKTVSLQKTLNSWKFMTEGKRLIGFTDYQDFVTGKRFNQDPLPIQPTITARLLFSADSPYKKDSSPDAVDDVVVRLKRLTMSSDSNFLSSHFIANSTTPIPRYLEYVDTDVRYDGVTKLFSITPKKPLLYDSEYYVEALSKVGARVAILEPNDIFPLRFKTVSGSPDAALNVTVSSGEIRKGDSATISWQGTNINEVDVREQGRPWLQSRPEGSSSSTSVKPKQTTTYIVRARGQASNFIEKSVEIKVTDAQAPPQDEPTKQSDKQREPEKKAPKQKPKRPTVKVIVPDGGVTLSKPLLLQGTADPGSEVRLTIESNPILLITKADDQGNWRYEYYGPIDANSHTVKVASILDGEVSEISDSSFSIAQAPQTATATAPSRATDQSQVSSPSNSSLTPSTSSPASSSASASTNVSTPSAKKTGSKTPAVKSSPSSTPTPAAQSSAPSSTPVGQLLPEIAPSAAGTAPIVNVPVSRKGVLVRRGKKPVKISGRAQPGQRIRITIHSEPITTEVVTDAQGNWSYDLDQPLDPGLHTLAAAPLDEKGVEGPATEVNFTVADQTTNTIVIGGAVIGIGVVMMVAGLVVLPWTLSVGGGGYVKRNKSF